MSIGGLSRFAYKRKMAEAPRCEGRRDELRGLRWLQRRSFSCASPGNDLQVLPYTPEQLEPIGVVDHPAPQQVKNGQRSAPCGGP